MKNRVRERESEFRLIFRKAGELDNVSEIIIDVLLPGLSGSERSDITLFRELEQHRTLNIDNIDVAGISANTMRYHGVSALSVPCDVNIAVHLFAFIQYLSGLGVGYHDEAIICQLCRGICVFIERAHDIFAVR